MNRLLSRSDVQYPLYSVYEYAPGLYKVIRHKCAPGRKGDLSRKGTSTSKFKSSLCRARSRVLELGLCNSWDYFCTFTLDPKKYDRYDLDTWYKDFSQWIRDQRKKDSSTIAYVLVPERHKDGAWHIHGLISGLNSLVPFWKLLADGDDVPLDLAKSGYLNWPAYQEKFGYCCLGEINSHVAVAFYITKYLTKAFDTDSLVGQHLYFCSRGLNNKVLHSSVYEPTPELDYYIKFDFKSCAVGWAGLKFRKSWTFGLSPGDCEPFPEDVPDDILKYIKDVDDFQFSQLSFL